VDNKRPDRSPFALAKLGEEVLTIASSIGHAQDDLKQYMNIDSRPKLPDRGATREDFVRLANAPPACFSLAWESSVAMTDGYATLIDQRTGLYRCFSLEKGTLVKAGNIFQKVTHEMVSKGGYRGAVLCVNPEKAGTILIGAQDENHFITEGGDAIKEANEATGMTLQEKLDMVGRRMYELALQNPYIVWYRIYPENGKVEKLNWAPEGGSLNREGGKNDIWRPMPDGSIQTGNIHFSSILKHLEKPKDKESPDEGKNEAGQKADPPKANSDVKKNDIVAK
jgi:hypothetical protein